MTDEWAPSDVQEMVHVFQEAHGHWPMWVSIQWRLAEEFDLSGEEADQEIADAVRSRDVVVALGDRHWILALAPEVQDMISVWFLQPDHDREDS